MIDVDARKREICNCGSYEDAHCVAAKLIEDLAAERDALQHKINAVMEALRPGDGSGYSRYVHQRAVAIMEGDKP